MAVQLSAREHIIVEIDTSMVADAYELNWVADAKLHDIPTTAQGAVANIDALDHSPLGITTAEDPIRAHEDLVAEIEGAF